MTNTQAEKIGVALALIHGELQAIRAVLERNEIASQDPGGSDGPSGFADSLAGAILRGDDVAISVSPGAAAKRDARSKRGRR
jgi:hypothetical protein